ncbi:9860_t:CDS:2, partial [Funneliformis geosporum]
IIPKHQFIPAQLIKVTEIPLDATEHRIRTVVSKLGKIVRLTIDTKNLWQQATITYSADSNFDNIKKGHRLFVLNDMVYNRKATYRNWAYVKCHCLDYTEG